MHVNDVSFSNLLPIGMLNREIPIFLSVLSAEPIVIFNQEIL